MKDSDWSMDDIPIAKYKVVTEPNPVTGEIKQITEIAGNIQREIIATKSNQVRNALIDMGWKPPEGKEHIPESKLPDHFADYAEDALTFAFFNVPIRELPLLDLYAVIGYYHQREFDARNSKKLRDI